MPCLAAARKESGDGEVSAATAATTAAQPWGAAGRGPCRLGAAGDAEAAAIAADLRRRGKRRVALTLHGDRRRAELLHVLRLAVLGRRGVAEVDRAEVVERQEHAPATWRLFHPLSRRLGGVVLDARVVVLARGVVFEVERPGALALLG